MNVRHEQFHHFEICRCLLIRLCVFFVPGESPCIFSKFNPLNTDPFCSPFSIRINGVWLYLWLQFGIQIPRTRTGIQFLESGIHGVQSRIQDCLEFPHMGRNKGEHETRVTGDNARKNITRERVWLRASTRTTVKIAWLTKCCLFFKAKALHKLNQT